MTNRELEELKDKVKLNFYNDSFDYDGDEHTSLDLDGEYLISLITKEQQRRVPSEDVDGAIAVFECLLANGTCKDMRFVPESFKLAIQALRQMQGWIPVKENIENDNG